MIHWNGVECRTRTYIATLKGQRVISSSEQLASGSYYCNQPRRSITPTPHNIYLRWFLDDRMQNYTFSLLEDALYSTFSCLSFCLYILCGKTNLPQQSTGNLYDIGFSPKIKSLDMSWNKPKRWKAGRTYSALLGRVALCTWLRCVDLLMPFSFNVTTNPTNGGSSSIIKHTIRQSPMHIRKCFQSLRLVVWTPSVQSLTWPFGRLATKY